MSIRSYSGAHCIYER